MSGQHNFTNANNRQALEQGSQFKRQLTFKESETGPAIDITGYTFQMQVRKRVGDPLVIEASTANGKITNTDEPNGVFEIDISSADTESLAAGTYKYDLEYTVSGETNRLLEGDFEVTAQVTS
jgi:hypothetical protein